LKQIRGSAFKVLKFNAGHESQILPGSEIFTFNLKHFLASLPFVQ